MPRAGKTPKPDPETVYIAWQGGCVEANGATHSFTAGQRLRGDSPAVQAASWCFVADGTPASEWPSVHADKQEQAERERRFEANPFDVRVVSQPVPVEFDLVVCRKELKVGYGPNRQGLPENIVTLEPGEVFSRDEQAVEKMPDHFEPFTPDTSQKGRRR